MWSALAERSQDTVFGRNESRRIKSVRVLDESAVDAGALPAHSKVSATSEAAPCPALEGIGPRMCLLRARVALM